MSDGQRGIEGGWGYWRTADIPSATATRSIQPPAVPVSTQAQGAAGHAGSGPDAPAMGEAGSGASLNAGSGPDASAMAEADSGASLNDVFGYWGKQYDKLAKQAAAAVGVDPATFTFERPRTQRTAHKGTGLEHANALIVGSSIKADGHWANPIDPARCEAMVTSVRSVRR